MKNGKESCISAFAGLNGLRGFWVFNVFLAVNLNASVEKLRTGKRVQHEVLVH